MVDFSLGAYWGQNHFNMDLRKINSEIFIPQSQFCYGLVSVAAIYRHYAALTKAASLAYNYLKFAFELKIEAQFL